MPSSYFLEVVTKMSGAIKGESLSTACPDQIQVKKFTIEMDSPTDRSTGTAASAPEMQPVQFDIPVSMASPALFDACCKNVEIKSVTLTCRKSVGGKEGTYLIWKFHTARICSYKMDTDAESPTDTLRITAAKVEVGYYRQKQDGGLESVRTTTWDWSTNKPWAGTIK